MIRNANLNDLDRIMEIRDKAVVNMKEQGIYQWPSSYPDLETFKKDINDNDLYVKEDDNLVIGVCAIKRENDLAYKEVKGWSFDDSFVIHRIIIDPLYQSKHIANEFIEKSVCIAKENSLQCVKVDTHPDNFKMKKFLLRNNFKYVGFSFSIYRECYELIF